MPYGSERKKIDEEEKAKFQKIHKKIGKIRRGEKTSEDTDYEVGQEKLQLQAMEKQAEKTGTSMGLGEAFRKKRQDIMKKEGFPETTTEQLKKGKLYGASKKLQEAAAKFGKKKTPKIRLKVR